MGKFIIEGGHRLSGEITPQGAKNEALEVISAVLLTADPVVLSNVPEILDVKNLIGLLQGMGVKVQRLEKGTYRFQADEVDTTYIETEEFVKKCAALGSRSRAATRSAAGAWTRTCRAWSPSARTWIMTRPAGLSI